MSMSNKNHHVLPPIPDKLYFTIGETSDLCDVKPHVLRYWEQEFTQLKPAKRRGGRRYYQHKDVVIIRKIRELLYLNGFTISGAKQQLQQLSMNKVVVEPSNVSPVLSVSPNKAPDKVSDQTSEKTPNKAPRSLETINSLLGELQGLLKAIKR